MSRVRPSGSRSQMSRRGIIALEPIDAAHQRMIALAAEVEGLIESLATEADVRLKVVNRVLVEVLGWPYDSIDAEPFVEGGGFADYVLLRDGLNKAVLEAKKDGRSFGLETRRAGGAYKVGGGVFKEEAVKEGIDQAIRYCGEKSAELACVTNGREWVVFRGSRSG